MFVKRIINSDAVFDKQAAADTYYGGKLVTSTVFTISPESGLYPNSLSETQPFNIVGLLALAVGILKQD